jgi:elongator complex protein 5
MSASVASPTVLLNRVLSLRESCPFLLASDTFVQSASNLTDELVQKAIASNPELIIVYLSYETVLPPSYIKKGKDLFISLLNKNFEKILSQYFQPSENPLTDKRKLIIVDSFNYINRSQIIQLLKIIMRPSHVVYGIYHQDIPTKVSNSQTVGPSAYSYLHFLSSCVFDVKPLDFEDSDSTYYKILTGGPQFPINIRTGPKSRFHLDLTYRRKSGRSLEYKFIIDSVKHEYENIVISSNTTTPEDESLLKDLTTFNLGTTKKQKEQKDKVDLPFLEAQKSMGSVGGSIVYEFEKDDDYDEEDPFEDPF